MLWPRPPSWKSQVWSSLYQDGDWYWVNRHSWWSRLLWALLIRLLLEILLRVLLIWELLVWLLLVWLLLVWISWELRILWYLRILRYLRMVICLLKRVRGGCDGSNVLIGWISLLRPSMSHHTDFLFFLPREMVPGLLGPTGRSCILY
ncbi:hypothetical protein MtrunA17_Chr3g0133231 [Medicago truncatula]|uniref:Transmembrane protein n=1 Tax=Medicago truncatula TaxID=3880 RepID=A0A396J0K5_MEDTR|nr:hypothetical protein MtrunA17_Chr3g0133231 [Medicago truncatula]